MIRDTLAVCTVTLVLLLFSVAQAGAPVFDQEFLHRVTSNEMTHKAMLNVLKRDIYSYFDLPYMSDLKKKEFEQSDSCKFLMDSINAIRADLVSDWHSVSMVLESEYDLKRRGFEIHTVSNYDAEPLPSRGVGIVSFSQMPYIETRGYAAMFSSDPMLKTTKMMLYCDEKTALAIEGNSGNIIVLLIFKIDGWYRKNFRHFDALYGGGWYDTSREMISTTDVSAVVVTKDLGTVYFVKSCPNN